MRLEQRIEAVQTLIGQCKPKIYRSPEEVSDAEALGVIVAQWAEWDGNKIIEAFLAALEDANFHTEREQIEELLGREA
jgi:hypothetical protein